MKYYRVGQAADIIGVSASTLRRYTAEGRIHETRNPAGQRTYTQETIDKFLGKSSGTESLVFYVRSSDSDKVKLNRQVDLLNAAYGEPLRVYSDNASGLNENRSGLKSLLLNAEKGTITTVAITQKDRLTRFGYSYLEKLLKVYKVDIIVLGEPELKAPTEELLQDFMILIASFSGKFYRLRGYAQQQLLLEKAGEVIAEKKSNN